MNTPVHRLMYYSRNRLVGSAELMSASISAILAASRRNNARLGVTGALMFNAGCFAQVLEGPRLAVGQLFERIQQDERHGDISLLAFGPAPGRGFPGWSMGFVGTSLTDQIRYGRIADVSGYDPARMTGEAMFETLQRLALEEEQRTG